MATMGTVKWFNEEKGYGFIAVEGDQKDIFVHVTALKKSGLEVLKDGDLVEFDLEPNRGKEAAINIRVRR